MLSLALMLIHVNKFVILINKIVISRYMHYLPVSIVFDYFHLWENHKWIVLSVYCILFSNKIQTWQTLSTHSLGCRCHLPWIWCRKLRKFCTEHLQSGLPTEMHIHQEIIHQSLHASLILQLSKRFWDVRFSMFHLFILSNVDVCRGQLMCHSIALCRSSELSIADTLPWHI